MNKWSSLASQAFNRLWIVKTRFKKDRKEFVCSVILAERPKNILEIGARNGTLAKRMLMTCREKEISSSYTGIDLFSELMDEELFRLEVSQWPSALKELNSELINSFPEFKIRLIQGFSKNVLDDLKNERFDLIIIDGGHSYHTVLSDWNQCSKLLNESGSIIFDDYTDEVGVVKGGIGVKQVVDNDIDYNNWKIIKFSSIDFFLHDWGILRTRMVHLKKFISETYK
jgi:predicted O-methyltransferase YrrM